MTIGHDTGENKMTIISTTVSTMTTGVCFE